jgi:hypothetical protein
VCPLSELKQGVGVSDLWVWIGGQESERRMVAGEGGGGGAGGRAGGCAQRWGAATMSGDRLASVVATAPMGRVRVSEFGGIVHHRP